MTYSRQGGQSSNLDLDRFFFAVKDQPYVVIKLQDDFSCYRRGSDIDVFCYDMAEFASRILCVGNGYVEQGFKIRVSDKGEAHTHLDFYHEGRLVVRFDLYQSLPHYQRIRLKPHFFFSIIENAETLEREFEGEKYPVYVPSPVDDLLLRYVEYLEWYELRPDKVGHLDYILGAVSADSSRIGFLDKLHLYTELPAPKTRNGPLSRINAFRWLGFWIKKARSIPPRRFPGIVLRKLRQWFLGLPQKFKRRPE